jgi:hypothetical protein
VSNNWLDLGLTDDEEARVREGAEIYKATYVRTLDSVFKIAEAIRILQRCNYGSGGQGAFAAALIQYGFINRDGGPIDKSIRSNLREMLENEEAVRAWWNKVPDRTKRDWVSARAIYRRWKASKQPRTGLPTPAKNNMLATAKGNKEKLDAAEQEIEQLKAQNAELEAAREFDAAAPKVEINLTAAFATLVARIKHGTAFGENDVPELAEAGLFDCNDLVELKKWLGDLISHWRKHDTRMKQLAKAQAKTSQSGRRQACGIRADGDRPAPEALPTNEGEYLAYFNAWFANTSDLDIVAERWNAEKQMRSDCRVSKDKRDELRELIETTAKAAMGRSFIDIDLTR